jgi:hypothetical protein
MRKNAYGYFVVIAMVSSSSFSYWSSIETGARAVGADGAVASPRYSVQHLLRCNMHRIEAEWQALGQHGPVLIQDA